METPPNRPLISCSEVALYFRFSAGLYNRLRNKHLTEYLRNNRNELETVWISEIYGSMLSNNSWLQIKQSRSAIKNFFMFLSWFKMQLVIFASVLDFFLSLSFQKGLHMERLLTPGCHPKKGTAGYGSGLRTDKMWRRLLDALFLAHRNLAVSNC